MNLKKYFPLYFLFGILAIIVEAGINNPGGGSGSGGDIFSTSNNVFNGSTTGILQTITNTGNGSYLLLNAGSSADPACASIIAGGTNFLGKFELEACNISGVERTLLRCGSSDSIVLDWQTGALSFGTSGNENVNIGNSSKTLTLPSLTTIVGGGASWGGGDLIWTGVAGTLTNQGSFTSIKTITASNFVQSAGIGGFVGNGSGLTNLTGTGVGGFTAGSTIFAGATGALSQDNTSFFYDFTNHRLGIGTNANILARIHLVSTNGVESGIFVDSFSPTATQGASIVSRRARGTQGSPSAVQSGDLLGSWGGRGFGSTIFTASSRSKIHFMASENWTDTTQGSRTEFYTTAVGTTNTLLAMTLNDALGMVLAGTATISNLTLSAGSGTLNGLTTTQIQTNISGNIPWQTITVSGNATTIGTNAVPIGSIFGGTGTNVAFTLGSVIFSGPSGQYNQNNSKFFWDNTNIGLGINSNVMPAGVSLEVNGALQVEGPPVITVTGALTGVINGVTGLIPTVYVTNVAADFPSILTLAGADLNFAVPASIQTNAVVTIGRPSTEVTGLVTLGLMTNAGQVVIRARNVSSGTIDQASLPYRIQITVQPTQ